MWWWSSLSLKVHWHSCHASYFEASSRMRLLLCTSLFSLIEHSLPEDPDLANTRFVAQSEELWEALEASGWSLQPEDKISWVMLGSANAATSGTQRDHSQNGKPDMQPLNAFQGSHALILPLLRRLQPPTKPLLCCVYEREKLISILLLSKVIYVWFSLHNSLFAIISSILNTCQVGNALSGFGNAYYVTFFKPAGRKAGSSL